MRVVHGTLTGSAYLEFTVNQQINTSNLAQNEEVVVGMGTMLAQVLALAVALASLTLYMAAFFLPEVYRRFDFIWSGVAMFYALVLWVYAPVIQGGLLIGNVACVVLLAWMGWQVLKMRRQMTPFEQQTWMPEGTRSPVDVLQYQWRQLRTRLPLPASLKPKPEPQIPTAVLETPAPTAPTRPLVTRQPKPRYKRPPQGVQSPKSVVEAQPAATASASPQQAQEGQGNQLRPENGQMSLRPSAPEPLTHADETALADRSAPSPATALSRGAVPEQPVAVEASRSAAIAPSDASTAATADAVASITTPTKENPPQPQAVAARPEPKKRSILVLPRTKKKNWLEKIRDWVKQPFAAQATTQPQPTQPLAGDSTSAAPATGDANLDDFDFDFDAPAPAATPIAEAVGEVPLEEATIVTLDETLAAEVIGSDVPLSSPDADIVTLDATLAAEVAPSTAEGSLNAVAASPGDLSEIQAVAFEELEPPGQAVAADQVALPTLQAIAPEPTPCGETAVDLLATALPGDAVSHPAAHLTQELPLTQPAEVGESSQSTPNATLAERVAEELALSEAIAQKIIEARQIGSAGLVEANTLRPTSPPEMTHATGGEVALPESLDEIPQGLSVAAEQLPTDAPPGEPEAFPFPGEAASAPVASDEAIAFAATDAAIAATTVLHAAAPAAEAVPVFQENAVFPPPGVAPQTPEEPPADNRTPEPAIETDLENELDCIFVLPPDVSLVEDIASPTAGSLEDSLDLPAAELPTLTPAPSPDSQIPQHPSQMAAAPQDLPAAHGAEAEAAPSVPEAIAPSPSPDFVTELRDLLEQSDRQSSDFSSFPSTVNSPRSERSENSTLSPSSPLWDSTPSDFPPSDLTLTLQRLLNTPDPNPEDP